VIGMFDRLPLFGSNRFKGEMCGLTEGCGSKLLLPRNEDRDLDAVVAPLPEDFPNKLERENVEESGDGLSFITSVELPNFLPDNEEGEEKHFTNGTEVQHVINKAATDVFDTMNPIFIFSPISDPP